MSTERPRQPQQVDPPHPVVDIEELHKEVRTRRTMQLRDSKDTLRRSGNEIRELILDSASDVNVLALCTCQQSKDFPYCDNTHKLFNKATNSNMAPLYVVQVEGRNCNECGSKLNASKEITCPTNATDDSRGCSITLSEYSANTTTITPTTPPQTLRRSRSLLKSTDKQTPTPTVILPQPTSTLHTPPDLPITNTPTTPITTNITTNLTTTPIIETRTYTETPSKPNIQLLKDNSGSPASIAKESPCNILREVDEEKPARKNKVTYTPSSTSDPRNKYNIISKAEVAEHDAQDDLWMIIKGNVYDITTYVSCHPGGVRALVKFAGKDGTENVQYHSPKMLEILNSQYFVGRLPKEEGGGGGMCIIS